MVILMFEKCKSVLTKRYNVAHGNTLIFTPFVQKRKCEIFQRYFYGN